MEWDNVDPYEAMCAYNERTRGAVRVYALDVWDDDRKAWVCTAIFKDSESLFLHANTELAGVEWGIYPLLLRGGRFII